MQLTSLALSPPVSAPDRTLSETPDSVIPPSSPVIVLVDPVSTGACLAKELADRGHRCVMAGCSHTHTERMRACVCWHRSRPMSSRVRLCERRLVRVWSDTCPDNVKAHTKQGTEVSYIGEVQVASDDFEAAVAAVGKYGPIRDVMVGCESGVLCADRLAAALGMKRSNGEALSALRRNKWHQIEAVRAAGLDAPLQKLAVCAADVDEWLATASHQSPFKAVVKPVEGAGSDGVAICDSPEEVRSAFNALEGTRNVLGLVNYEVLLQEYLLGDEYVIDTVSAAGCHKVVAIWKYDKREANGAPVVYFGMRLLELHAEPELAAMVAYVEGVLDAIGIEWGAMHTEVKLEARGPVLVEVNGRLHGGEGIWLPIADACLGYTQVSAMCDAYLNHEAFNALPRVPTGLRAHGAWVTVRSSAGGAITRIDHGRIETIRQLPSYLDEYVPLAVGKHVAMTVDACTVHGCFNLAHPDPEQLASDYATAQALVDAGLFDVEEATNRNA